MSVLQNTKVKRYSVELPTDLVFVLKMHLKETFANKTQWFVQAIEKKLEEDRKNLENQLKIDM